MGHLSLGIGMNTGKVDLLTLMISSRRRI